MEQMNLSTKQTDSQTQRIDLWLPSRVGRGTAWEFGVGRCKAFYLEWINKPYCI